MGQQHPEGGQSLEIEQNHKSQQHLESQQTLEILSTLEVLYTHNRECWRFLPALFVTICHYLVMVHDAYRVHGMWTMAGIIFIDAVVCRCDIVCTLKVQ